MIKLTEKLRAQLLPPAFPRSANYDPAWVMENVMGPNPLWLAESLTQLMDLKPGMRVLDMGCGKAITSIFLAKEFGVQVWAADLWISPTDNWKRIVEANLEAQVCPIRVEAHELPFAECFFDAMVSFDAYHYFGTNNLYLSYFQKFARKGAQIGIVSPGLTQELNEGLPAYLAPYWEPDFYSFHSPEWWKTHWTRSDSVTVQTADLMPDGCELWRIWNEAFSELGIGPLENIRREIEMVRVDAGRALGFTRLLATKR